ncbi:hypothetical protein Sme01_62110 [Sphaerisporangium melleum]|uniref:Uncharacterized protein n=1 Tax=Sphaerisporangium melleum TaxID=321316 RepID=A0A917VNB2_9ACTN|nr:hypothetical protein [Sphaerisporangium melleum]GGK98379.1 hypothetical protein GCM10007964_45730 [Sphaerisporangium melleum]GII73735.1 hypothetical protein Sme01_62110 [Sphaerisporangium melleum]
MGWLRETTAQWIRILTVTGDRSLSMHEQSHLISEVNGPIQLKIRLRPYRRRWQRAVAGEVLDATEVSTRTTLNRYLLASTLTTGHLIGRLHEATGESREQILQTMSITLDRLIAEEDDDPDA